MTSTTRRVAFVVGDIGSTKELVLASREILPEEMAVDWYVDQKGKAQGLLQDGGIEFETIAGGKRREWSQYGAVVVGTSATAYTAQKQVTQQAKEADVPVVWYEDLWGTGERPEVKDVSPDKMFVIDKEAVEIARSARPEIEVEVVGKPSFASLVHFTNVRVGEVRRTLRERLEIPQDQMVVTVWTGGDRTRVVKQLQALFAIHEIMMDIVVIYRLHPKLPGREGVQEFIGDRRGALLNADGEDPMALSCASDMVIGDWGNTPCYMAPLVGTPTFMMLWPDDEQRRIETGFVDGIPPLLRTKVGGALRSYEVTEAVLRVIRGGVRLRQPTLDRARESFGDLVEPGAARRLADAIAASAQ
jgi:hypothetical protein